VSITITIGPGHPQREALSRRGLSALWEAWLAYTLKRAIADVASTREQDYRAFGLDKGELLAALRHLYDDIKGRRQILHRHPAGDSKCGDGDALTPDGQW
jgi:hypothetical protein